MASMEDLIATISGGLHAGQQGNDLKDLHVSEVSASACGGTFELHLASYGSPPSCAFHVVREHSVERVSSCCQLGPASHSSYLPGTYRALASGASVVSFPFPRSSSSSHLPRSLAHTQYLVLAFFPLLPLPPLPLLLRCPFLYDMTFHSCADPRQAKLAQTLHPSIPPQPYRPSAPPGASPAHSTGPMPPPAPASSWNSPPPSGYLSGLNGLNGLNALGGSPSFASLGSGSPSGRQPAFVGQRETGFAVSPKPNNGAVQGHAQGQGQGQGGDGVGAEIPAPRPAQFGRERDIATGNGGANGNGYGVNGAEASGIPYHSAVLPSGASPKDTGGFDEDAFRPLWNEEDAKSWEAFNARK